MQPCTSDHTTSVSHTCDAEKYSPHSIASERVCHRRTPITLSLFLFYYHKFQQHRWVLISVRYKPMQPGHIQFGSFFFAFITKTMSRPTLLLVLEVVVPNLIRAVLFLKQHAFSKLRQGHNHIPACLHTYTLLLLSYLDV